MALNGRYVRVEARFVGARRNGRTTRALAGYIKLAFATVAVYFQHGS